MAPVSYTHLDVYKRQAMSAEASDMSSWLLMGMPGLAYLTGIASPGWTAIGLAEMCIRDRVKGAQH